VAKGETADDLYIITAGKIQTTVIRGDRETIIGTAGPGNVIGEKAVIDGQARSATARAITPTVELLKIDGKAFRHVLVNRPDLSAQIMRIISLRLRQLISGVK